MSEPLAELFARRQLPRQTVPLPRDPQEFARLDREHSAAVWALAAARSGMAVDTVAERAAVAAAEAALQACPVLQVTLSALPPDEFDALVDEHPPTAEELARGHQWHRDTFQPALLARSVVQPEGHPPLDFAAMKKAGQVNAGEITDLFEVAVMLNVRRLSAAVGKER